MSRLSGLPWRGPPSPRILILGSFPSETSLALGRYYGHPRNHFWSLVSAAIGRGLPDGYDERLDILAAEGIALWDVIASCEREGSMDAAIRGEEANPLLDFLRERPSIARVALNGGKAAESFRKLVATELPPGALAIGKVRAWELPDGGGRTVLLCRLPSSSPIPTRDYREAADKEGPWTAFLRGVAI